MNRHPFMQQLDALYDCTETDEGLRIDTSCMLPSFKRVRVFVVAVGNGFKVHDNGCAFQSAWEHGRNEKLIKKALVKEANRFRLKLENEVFVSEVLSKEWLPSAVLSVANAASKAAYSAVDHIVAATEANLADRIYLALREVYSESAITREFILDGNSGKSHKFDYAVGDLDKRILLVDAVSPHHSSIAHKYTAFSDVKAALGSSMLGFAVFDKQLELEDASLMRQVADLVPISSVSEGAKRVLV